jgi:nitronate monooxygenase
MWFATKLSERIATRYPIIQAPMAGGPTTPELVAAVSNAGGLGTLGVAYQTPDAMRAAIRRVRELTDRPFGLNLLMTGYVAPTAAELAAANELLLLYRQELGLAEAPLPARFAESFDRQVAVVLEERVPVVSFAFGAPAPAVLSAFKRQGTLLVGTATTVAEALHLEALGMDVIVAQGAEAGGHRGTFLGPFEAALIGTMALVPQMVDTVKLPVVASGGIMDGRGILAALALGAAGVQMGTAFMLCPESGTSLHHRAAIQQSTDDTTCITRVYSGRPVRALENRFIREMRAHEREVPAYPIQNALTQELRREATKQGRPDLMGMWAGQASRLARALPAGQLLQAWVAQVEALIAGLGGKTADL